MEEDDTMTSFEGHHLTPDQERSTMLPSPLPPAWSSNPGDDVRSVFESAGISLKTVLSGIKKGALKSSGAGSGNRALLYGPARGQPLGIAVRQSLENKVYLLPQSIVQQLPPGSPVSFPREDGSACIPIVAGASIAVTINNLQRAARNDLDAVRFRDECAFALDELENTIMIWKMCNREEITPVLRAIALTGETSDDSFDMSLSGGAIRVPKLRLTIISDRFKSDISAFYRRGPGLYLTTYPYLTPTDRKIAFDIQDLIQRTILLGLVSIDIKPGNTVINYNISSDPVPSPDRLSEEEQEQLASEYSTIPDIVVRFIDVDADFVSVKQVRSSSPGPFQQRTGESHEISARDQRALRRSGAGSASNEIMRGDQYLWTSGSNARINYWLMMILMANHFYRFAGRNIFIEMFRESQALLIGSPNPLSMPREVLFDYLTDLTFRWLMTPQEKKSMPMDGYGEADKRSPRDATGINPLYPRLFIYFCNRAVPEAERTPGASEDYLLMGNSYFNHIPNSTSRINQHPRAALLSPVLKACMARFNGMMINCFYLNKEERRVFSEEDEPPQSAMDSSSGGKGKRKQRKTKGKRAKKGKRSNLRTRRHQHRMTK